MGTASSNDAAVYAELLESWRADPVAYVVQALGWRPTPWQERILRSVAEGGTTAVRTGHAVGKTGIAAAAVQWALAVFDAVTCLTTAPTSLQVKGLLWREIASQQARARWPLGGQLNQVELRVTPECYAFGLSTDKPDRFQGQHGVGSKAWGVDANDPERPLVFVVVDESSGVRAAIHDAVRAIATGARDRVLHIGNPTDPESRFATFFGPKSRAKQIHVSSLQAAEFAERHGVPGLCSRAWCDTVREELGEDSAYYQSRVLGEFPSEGDDVLIRLAWIEAAQRRWEDSDQECELHGCTWRERQAPSVVLGLDVARHGGDQIAWAVRQGADVAHLETWDHAESLDLVVDHTAALCAAWSATGVVVDATGMGWGVVDYLRKKKIAVTPVNFGERAKDEARFTNRRAELWWNLREWLRLGLGALPPDEKLLRDLLAPRYRFGRTGERFELEAKDHMRERLGRSPDRGDAVALCLVGMVGGQAPVVVERAPLTLPRVRGRFSELA